MPRGGRGNSGERPGVSSSAAVLPGRRARHACPDPPAERVLSGRSRNPAASGAVNPAVSKARCHAPAAMKSKTMKTTLERVIAAAAAVTATLGILAAVVSIAAEDRAALTAAAQVHTLVAVQTAAQD